MLPGGWITPRAQQHIADRQTMSAMIMATVILNPVLDAWHVLFLLEPVSPTCPTTRLPPRSSLGSSHTASDTPSMFLSLLGWMVTPERPVHALIPEPCECHLI